MSGKFEVIILAAGNSSRLGQAKQFVTFNHESLLIRQCKIAKQLSDNVSCVFGYQAQKMIDEVAALSIKTVINHDWQSGLSSSIAKGVSLLDDDTDAVMLLLVDQWQLNVEHCHKVLKLWQSHPDNIISAAQMINGKSVTAPPVIFPAYCFEQLKALTQGNGAKSVINNYQKQLLTVSIPEALIDLDTPKQLQRLKNYQQNQYERLTRPK